MNMFARFNENPEMTLQDIKETKRYGRTHGQRENSIPPTNKVCGGYNDIIVHWVLEHRDIDGNELPDSQAKEAANEWWGLILKISP